MVPTQCRTSLQEHVVVSSSPDCSLQGERDRHRETARERQKQGHTERHTQRDRKKEGEKRKEEEEERRGKDAYEPAGFLHPLYSTQVSSMEALLPVYGTGFLSFANLPCRYFSTQSG